MCDFYSHLTCYNIFGTGEFINNIQASDLKNNLPDVHGLQNNSTPKNDNCLEKTEQMITDLTESVKNIKEDQKCMKRSLFSINYSMKKQNKSLQDIESRLETIENSMADLIMENLTFNGSVKVLENGIGQSDQVSTRNNLEIHGVPERPDEKTEDIVIKVGSVLGIKISLSDIDYTYRFHTKNTEVTPRAPGIMVRFVCHRIKAEVLRLRKEKANLTTEDIQMTHKKVNNIYINESLTASNRKLHGKGRALQKENKIKYVWIKDGKVLCRKKNGCKVVEIKRPQDLNTSCCI